MEKKKERSGSKTQQGFVVPDAQVRRREFDDTIPVGTVRPSDLANRSSSDDLITSASAAHVAATETGAGCVTLTGERVGEELARELIVKRMAKEGIVLESDMAFSYGDLLVTLDGYDTSRNIGYQFISHAGDDVVTDFDPMVEARLKELAVNNIANVLVIHDYNATDADAILEAVELFLVTLPE